LEKIVVLLIPALMTLLLIRWLFLPVRTVCKVALHSLCGFLCLWMLNTLSPFTGIVLPVNAITVLTAGTLGIPGIGIVALLAVI